MTKKMIKGSKIITENCILYDHVLIFEKGIENIVLSDDVEFFDGEIIEHEGYVSPGFVDIHIHGASGYDVMDGSIRALEVISESVLVSGTTTLLATTMTMDQEHILKALDNVREYMLDQNKTDLKRAKIAGVHLEGPFINPEFKGAQDEANILKPSMDLIKDHLDIIKIITLAPEMDFEFEFIKSLKDSGIVLSMGHTGIDYETACGAFDAGVSHVSHCFNAMSGLHHRNPGAVGAALAKPFTVDIITDGVHIHKGFIGPFIKMKSVDKTILITDSIRASYLDSGEYDLGGQRVYVDKGCCKLVDGTIAGSILTMDQALRNVVANTEFKLEEIIRMLSLNPARRVGLDDNIGSIEVGKKADLVLMNDDLEIIDVFIDGQLVNSGGRYEYTNS